MPKCRCDRFCGDIPEEDDHPYAVCKGLSVESVQNRYRALSWEEASKKLHELDIPSDTPDGAYHYSLIDRIDLLADFKFKYESVSK